jgi:hypothetical protein
MSILCINYYIAIELGQISRSIKSLKSYIEYKKELEDLGFVYSNQSSSLPFLEIVAAFETYKNNTNISRNINKNIYKNNTNISNNFELLVNNDRNDINRDDRELSKQINDANIDIKNSNLSIYIIYLSNSLSL